MSANFLYLKTSGSLNHWSLLKPEQQKHFMSRRHMRWKILTRVIKKLSVRAKVSVCAFV